MEITIIIIGIDDF